MSEHIKTSYKKSLLSMPVILLMLAVIFLLPAIGHPQKLPALDLLSSPPCKSGSATGCKIDRIISGGGRCSGRDGRRLNVLGSLLSRLFSSNQCGPDSDGGFLDGLFKCN